MRVQAEGRFLKVRGQRRVFWGMANRYIWLGRSTHVGEHVRWSWRNKSVNFFFRESLWFLLFLRKKKDTGFGGMITSHVTLEVLLILITYRLWTLLFPYVQNEDGNHLYLTELLSRYRWANQCLGQSKSVSSTIITIPSLRSCEVWNSLSKIFIPHFALY